MNKILSTIIVLLIAWLSYLNFRVDSLNQELKADQLPSTHIQEVNVSGFSTDLTEVVKLTQTAVVGIQLRDNHGTYDTGSGVIWDVRDEFVYVVSDSSIVVDENEIIIVFDNGSSYSGSLVGIDEVLGLALISVQPEFSVEPIIRGDSTLLQGAEWVIALGSSQTNASYGSISVGVVSKVNLTQTLDLDKDGINDWESLLIQSDLTLGRGNTGGPFINMNGEMIGLGSTMITNAGSTGATIIPIEEIELSIEHLITKGEVSRYWLGIDVLDISKMASYQKSYHGINLDQLEGMYVQNIQSNSVLASIGVRRGDILVMINDTSLQSFESYRRLLYSETEFQIESVTLLRDQEQIVLENKEND